MDTPQHHHVPATSLDGVLARVGPCNAASGDGAGTRVRAGRLPLRAIRPSLGHTCRLHESPSPPKAQGISYAPNLDRTPEGSADRCCLLDQPLSWALTSVPPWGRVATVQGFLPSASLTCVPSLRTTRPPVPFPRGTPHAVGPLRRFECGCTAAAGGGWRRVLWESTGIQGGDSGDQVPARQLESGRSSHGCLPIVLRIATKVQLRLRPGPAPPRGHRGSQRRAVRLLGAACAIAERSAGGEGPGGIGQGFAVEVSLEGTAEDERELPGRQSGKAGVLGKGTAGPRAAVRQGRGVSRGRLSCFAAAGAQP